MFTPTRPPKYGSPWCRQAAQHLADDDADLRAGLIGAITIGTVIGRHLLQLVGLRNAPEPSTALLHAAFHDIACGPAALKHER